MTCFDVFNGDADGMCALHQLRMVHPEDATLVTGVKRDIALLERVDARRGDRVTVLDVSLATNRDALVRLLDRGVAVEYFDHHYAGSIPVHPLLTATIDPAPGVCTGMLVDRNLGGRHRVWAVVAAFADNLTESAHRLADTLGLDPAQRHALDQLGETLSYNAYGDSEADLVVHPALLYQTMHRHSDPFEFIRSEPVCRRIDEQRRGDVALASAVEPAFAFPGGLIYILPDAAWSRRVRGVLANDLANQDPGRAHAVLSSAEPDGYTVSVRTPLLDNTGADTLCRKFATGGGRAAAAGINHLPRESLPDFSREFDRAFPRPVSATQQLPDV